MSEAAEKAVRIGPRMAALLKIIEKFWDGRAPSRAAAYMMLNYNGGSSNYYGDAVMCRLERRGLVQRHHDEPGPSVPVSITDRGRAALSGAVR